MTTDDRAGKVRENRLRRMAERQGLTFSRSRRRDLRAVDYGRYSIADATTNAQVFETNDLVDLERWLSEPGTREQYR